MMNLTNILLILVLIFQTLNFLLLFYFGAFLVSLKDDIKKIFLDDEEQNGFSFEAKSERSLTWDEKYERDMEEIKKMSRQSSGLTEP